MIAALESFSAVGQSESRVRLCLSAERNKHREHEALDSLAVNIPVCSLPLADLSARRCVDVESTSQGWMRGAEPVHFLDRANYVPGGPPVKRFALPVLHRNQ